MKICELCGKEFKNYVKINGQYKNVSKRKYCIDCSPYGKRNNSKLRKENEEIIRLKSIEKLLICNKCNKPYLYLSSNRKGCTTQYCNACNGINKRKKKKQQLVDIKGGSCCFCGYNRCNRALDFHHIEPELKRNNISQMIRHDIESLTSELEKTILVCHNCHMEIHDGLISLDDVLTKYK